MTDNKKLRNDIDDYRDTIHAIIGFMNFYRFDDKTKKMRSDIKVFQGRKLYRQDEKGGGRLGKIGYVTPDLGVLISDNNGVLGEVKKSFPKDEVLWGHDFKQLVSYDNDLAGWPSTTGKVDSHDIVLLLHQSRAVQLMKYYEGKKDKEIVIKRPFIIVEFNRSDESNQHYFFRKQYGILSDGEIDRRLTVGVSVPMKIYVAEYSTIKIYDGKPPLPYLLDVIWTNVVLDRASKDERFIKLKKKQKINIVLETDEIVELLHQGFSFYPLHEANDNHDGQVKTPKKEWIVEACEQLVKVKEADWCGEKKDKVTIYFQKYKDVLGHFTQICSGNEQDDSQLPLFVLSEEEKEDG